MDFIARIPQTHYVLIPEGRWVYGAVVSEDTLEFLCNEFKVHILEIISSADVKNLVKNPSARVWGNRELLTS